MSILRPLLDRLFALRANAYIVAVYRIGYGILSWLYILQCQEYSEFLWYGSPYLKISQAALYVWLPVTLAVTVGYRTRISTVLHFLFCSLLLDYQTSYPTVELLFFGMNAFWLMFLDAGAVLSVDAWRKHRAAGQGGPQSRWVAGWPVFVMGICLSIQFLTSGLNKAFDPLWVDGYGFYYTLLLPWLTPARLNFLLDYEWLMVAANYGGVAIECLIIFLYVIPRTRRLAVVSFVGMGLMFTVLFSGLGFIGPFLLTLTVLLLSLEWPGGSSEKNTAAAPDFYPRNTVMAWVPLVILIFIVLQFGTNIMPHIWRLRYPVVYADVAVSHHKGLSLRFTRDNTSRWVSLLSHIDKFTTRTRWLWLFNTNHFFGTFAYKVVAHLDDGTVREPVTVFYPDRRRNPHIPLSLMLQKRVIGEAAKSLIKYDAVQRNDYERLKGVLHFAMTRMDPDDRRHMRWLVIHVTPVRMPESFAGNYQGYLQEPWQEFFAYDAVKQTYSLFGFKGLKDIRLKLKHSPEYVYFRLQERPPAYDRPSKPE